MAGTLRKRTGPRGTSWQLLVRHGGKQYSRTVNGGSERAASRELARFVTEITSRPVTSAAGRTASFRELLDAYVDHMSPDWSESTARLTPLMIERQLAPLAETKLAKLTTGDIERFYGTLRRQGLGPARIRRIHSVVHAALELGVRWEWIVANPASRVRLAEVPKARVTPPTVDELRRLVAAAERGYDRAKRGHPGVTEKVAGDPTFALFIRLAAASGARRGELCEIQWDQFAGDILHVKGTKTESSDRKIVIDARTLELLQAHRTRMAARAQRVRVLLSPSSYVFSNDIGCSKPWLPEYVTRRFIEVRNAVGLTDVRLHDLRHWSATTLLDGFSPVDVSKRHGHSRTSTTTDIYGHARHEIDRAMAETLGRLLG